MVTISVSVSFETLQSIHEFNRKEAHHSMSAGVSNLILLGLAYTAMLDAQDKDQVNLTGQKVHAYVKS